MGTVLLIEDDEDIRDVMSEALRGAGHHVLAAPDGRDGLDRLQGAAMPPDLILLDLMMPDMDGPEFLRVLRQDARWAKLPVVVITAAGRTTRDQAGLEVAGWLLKPVELYDLLEAAARFCAPRSPARPMLSSHGRGAAYLERRRAEVGSLRTLLAERAHAEIRRIGHNLRGSAASFGHPEIGAVGARLEQAAAAGDIVAMGRTIDDLAALLPHDPPE